MSNNHLKFWPDRSHRGETVKALIVLRPDWPGKIDAQAIIDWCREHTAAFKVPRIGTFVDSLPRSGTGKIQWRELQDRESAVAQPEDISP